MKNILVREYLQSLTESEELDYIFPILLEVMDFQIISKPADTKGLAQYGKDVVAIGTDQDGIRKRFYFEIKGGADKDITTNNYNKADGIRESIHEAKDRPFKDNSNPGFNQLPIKIVVVHNGIIHPSVKETFDGFIEREFPEKKDTTVTIIPGIWKIHKKANADLEFERWDLYKLTELFTQYLFNEYLLTDDEAVSHFKKVLVLINTPRNNYGDFFQLINSILSKVEDFSKLGERKKLLFFETLRMISFIVYHYSKNANNLHAAKKCIPYSVLNLWGWILQNKLEKDKKVLIHFEKHLEILIVTLAEYFEKTLPAAMKKDGLYSPQGGRYEQVGYPIRSMEYLSYLIFFLETQKANPGEEDLLRQEQMYYLIEILNKNDGTTRPFFDNHSIPIVLVIRFLIDKGRREDAKSYLRNIITSIQIAYFTLKRLPDGRSRMESIIQYAVTKTKSVYYEDGTSHLLGILLELTAVLDMEAEYLNLKKLIQDAKVDTALFVPFTDPELMTNLPENRFSHEVHLMTHELHSEGFQDEVRSEETFTEFRDKTLAKPLFAYDYKSKAAGFPELVTLSHIYFKTPVFPDRWRDIR
jgi:hypothetical protein